MCFWNVKFFRTEIHIQGVTNSSTKWWIFFCESQPRIYQSDHPKPGLWVPWTPMSPQQPPRETCSWMMRQPYIMPRAAVALRSANCYSESIRNWTFRRHFWAMQKMVLWRLPFLKLTCPHMFPEKMKCPFQMAYFQFQGGYLASLAFWNVFKVPYYMLLKYDLFYQDVT